MRARVVDTSLLVASVDPQDPHHADALALLAEPGPVVVPNEVLVETLGLMTHRASRQEAQAFLRVLVGTEGIELGHETDMSASLALLANFPSLSIVDACGVTLAWRLGAELDTFDVRQRRAYGSR